MLFAPATFTVTSIGSIVWEPSVTLKVTFAKFPFVFVNCSFARPICVVPASVRFALALPLKVKSVFTLYRLVLASAV